MRDLISIFKRNRTVYSAVSTSERSPYRGTTAPNNGRHRSLNTSAVFGRFVERGNFEKTRSEFLSDTYYSVTITLFVVPPTEEPNSIPRLQNPLKHLQFLQVGFFGKCV